MIRLVEDCLDVLLYFSAKFLQSIIFQFGVTNDLNLLSGLSLEQKKRTLVLHLLSPSLLSFQYF